VHSSPDSPGLWLRKFHAGPALRSSDDEWLIQQRRRGVRGPEVWRECELRRVRLAVLRPYPTARFSAFLSSRRAGTGRPAAMRLARLRKRVASTRRSGAELGPLATVLGQAPIERRREIRALQSKLAVSERRALGVTAAGPGVPTNTRARSQTRHRFGCAFESSPWRAHGMAIAG
jgi:hypothetical protein